MIKKIAIFACGLTVAGLFATAALAQEIYQQADKAKPNTYGGYDYYDDNGAKTGYSVPNTNGGYDYYGNDGKFQGSLKRRGRYGYTYHDDRGIEKGAVSTTPSGEYRYKDRDRGGAYKVTPIGQDKSVGEVSPNEFKY